MRWSLLTASTSTTWAHSNPNARATGSCCAKPASFSMMARWSCSMRIAYYSQPLAAAPAASPNGSRSGGSANGSGFALVVVPVTDQWATVALTGQHARTILERLKPECDLSNEAFPHLGFRATRLFGSEARIYRVSFSGELTYEINVPAHKGCELWAALLEEGRSFGIEPFGVDALLHLRMEKGFLHVGADTDGTTVPDDVGFGKPAAAKRSHYVGKRSLSLPENRSARSLAVDRPLRGGGASRCPSVATCVCRGAKWPLMVGSPPPVP